MQKLKDNKLVGGGARRPNFKTFNAFTLAEMMVVMLIVSIVLAAMAPVMTTKNKVDNSSPWRYSPANSSDAYFGAGGAMRALIGQVNGEDSDLGKLIINNNATGNSHILFKSNNDVLGDLYFNGSSVILGSRPSNSTNATYGANNISIGPNNWSSTGVEGNSNITIGDNSMQALTSGVSNIGIGTTMSTLTTGSNNVAVGDNSLLGSNGDYNVAVGTRAYRQGTGGSNVVIGGDAMSQYSGNNNVVMGTQAMYYGSGNNNVAIGTNANYNGTNSEATYEGTTAVGHNAQARSLNSTAIGREAIAGTASGNSASSYYYGPSVAIGYQSNATGSYSIAIGQSANAKGDSSIGIGYNTQVEDSGIAIGHNGYANALGVSIGIGGTRAEGRSSIAINGLAEAEDAIALGVSEAKGQQGIAIGIRAHADGYNNVAIGANACQYVTGSNKTCIGAGSGPYTGDSWASDSTERVFIGGRSNFNGGVAVLEVHNDTGTEALKLRNKKLEGYYTVSKTGVVINGNLFVKGAIYSIPMASSAQVPFTPQWHSADDNSGYDNGVSSLWVENGMSSYYYNKAGTASSNIQTWNYSDRRLKYVGKENTSGLDKIRQLKVFNYTFKKDTTKTPHVGVIAQDLQKVFPNAVKKGTDGFLTIRMEDMFYAVVNAIKELDAKITALQKENQELRQMVKQVQENNKRLDERLKKLEAKK